MNYVAFVHKEPQSCFGVSFPDFPGCVSAGDSLGEAVANGAEALCGHVRLMKADGNIVPKPRTLGAIKKDASLADDRMGASLVLIALSQP